MEHHVGLRALQTTGDGWGAEQLTNELIWEIWWILKGKETELWKGSYTCYVFDTRLQDLLMGCRKIVTECIKFSNLFSIKWNLTVNGIIIQQRSVVKSWKLKPKSRFLASFQFIIDLVKAAQCDSLYWLLKWFLLMLYSYTYIILAYLPEILQHSTYWSNHREFLTNSD